MTGTFLETKASLKFNHPARQNSKWLTEPHVIDASTIALRLEWRQISNVEDIEKVEAYIQVWRFSENTKAWQPDALGKAHIDIEVFRAPENISADSRWIRQEVLSVNCGAEKLRTAARENAARTQEVVIGIIIRLSTEIGNRSNWPKEIAVWPTQARIDDRRPWKSGVVSQDAINLPSTKELPSPVSLVSIERKIP